MIKKQKNLCYLRYLWLFFINFAPRYEEKCDNMFVRNGSSDQLRR